MAALAIVQLVRLQEGAFGLAGILTAAYIVAGAVGQPALGRWIDRSGQTVVLATAAVVATGGFVVMAVATPAAPAVAVVGAVLAGAFTPPLEPALRTLWPVMVREPRALASAFSLDAGAQELVFIAGPLLTVAGIAAFGSTGNVFFAAALGLLGTVAFAAHRLSREYRPERPALAAIPRRSPLRDARFRRVVAVLVGIGLPVGVLTIVVTAYGERAGLPDFAGWALAANALGALIGATVSALRPGTASPERRIALLAGLLGVLYLPLAATGMPAAVVLVAALVAGLLLPPALGRVFGWVQAASDPRHLTEANAWAISAINVGIASGTALAGLVVGAAGVGALPLVVIVASAVTLATSILVLPRRIPVQTTNGGTRTRGTGAAAE
nr:MFS transporter [Galbitalea soli]